MNKLYEEIWGSSDLGVRGVKVFEGFEEGPSVGLMCLTHGNEYAGLEALTGAVDYLRGLVRGRVIVTCNNLVAAEQGKRFVEEDMNRLFVPGGVRGESLEARRLRELMPVFDQMDIAFDLHSVTSTTDAVPFTVIPGETAGQIKLARQLDVDYQVLYPGYVNGTGSTSDYFVERGKTCITLEQGYEGASNLNRAVANVRRYLAYCGVIDGAEEFVDGAEWLRLNQMEWVKRPNSIEYAQDFVRKSFQQVFMGQLIAKDKKKAYFVKRSGRLLFAKNLDMYGDGSLPLTEPFVYLAEKVNSP